MSLTGEVLSAEVLYDPFNGYSKDKGYVKMKTLGGGLAAIKSLHGKEIKGQLIQVQEKQEDIARLSFSCDLKKGGALRPEAENYV